MHISESGRHYAHKENELSKVNFENNEFMIMNKESTILSRHEMHVRLHIKTNKQNIGTKAPQLSQSIVRSQRRPGVQN